MTDDVAATVTALQAEGIEIARPVSDQGWGLLTAITLPGGIELGVPAPPPDRGPAALSWTHPIRQGHIAPSSLATGCYIPACLGRDDD